MGERGVQVGSKTPGQSWVMVEEVQGPTAPAPAFSQNYNSFRKAQTQATFALSSPDPQQGSVTEKK